MIHGSLTGLARALSATLLGPDPGFQGVSTDTRTLPHGALFVALRGPNFDGHEFVAAAAEAGAAAAVVDHPVPVNLPQLLVEDTLQGLGAIAANWRSRFDIPVLAVTGSFGKTTVKEMMAAIAVRRGEILATRGNYNNEIGLPLTLFRLDESHRAAVLELGANHGGEIARMVAICRPSVGLVTAAGPVHLEGFGSLEGVARGKGEMFSGLPEDGTAVINCDDRFAPLWRELAGSRRTVGFGLGADAEFRAEDVRQSLDAAGPLLEFRLVTPDGTAEAQVRLPGRHNVMNALAAAGIERDRIFLTNAVKHFKFRLRGKRRLHQKPDAGEIDHCRWWLGLELQMVAPRAVIALGATAARSLLGRPITIGESRGHALALDDGTPVWITVHPSYILRQQDDEAREREMHRFVADLRKAMP